MRNKFATYYLPTAQFIIKYKYVNKELSEG